MAHDPARRNSHVADCPRCQAELALLKEFESGTPLADEGAAVAWISAQLERRLDQIKNANATPRTASAGSVGWLARLFGTGNPRWLMPAAAIVVIAVATGILLRSSKQPELQANLGSGPTVYRSQEVELIAPAGELSKAPKDLQWQAFAGATQYKVSLMEVDHAPLWSAATNYISLTIPNPTRAKMLPGKPVLWQVTALDAQGRRLAVSQIQRFSVTRKSNPSTNGSLPQ